MRVELTVVPSRAVTAHVSSQTALVSSVPRIQYRNVQQLGHCSRQTAWRTISTTMSRAGRQGHQGTTHPCTINLVLDFDGTLTKKDTMHLVAEAGYARQRRLQRRPQPRPWAEIVDAYISDFEAHTDAYLPKPADRTTYEQEIAWLNSLRPAENASIERAIKAGIFDQVSEADMAASAEEALKSGLIQFRNGSTELLTFIEQHNAQLSATKAPDRYMQVISVNWSACFVRQVLRGCVQRAADAQDHASSQLSERIQIYANEIPSLVGGGIQIGQTTQPGTKRPQPGSIRTSADKVSVLGSICDRYHGWATVFVYVGDSTTDLECLMAADVGICVRDEPMGSGQKELAGTCERLGIEVLPIQDRKVFTSSDARRLLWATDFEEIKDWLETHRDLLGLIRQPAMPSR